MRLIANGRALRLAFASRLYLVTTEKSICVHDQRDVSDRERRKGRRRKKRRLWLTAGPDEVGFKYFFAGRRRPSPQINRLSLLVFCFCRSSSGDATNAWTRKEFIHPTEQLKSIWISYLLFKSTNIFVFLRWLGRAVRTIAHISDSFSTFGYSLRSPLRRSEIRPFIDVPANDKQTRNKRTYFSIQYYYIDGGIWIMNIFVRYFYFFLFFGNM